jgi:signal transduction histidine kinase
MNLVEVARKMTISKTAVTRAICLLVAVMTFGLLAAAAPLRYQMLLDDAYGYGAPLAEIGLSLRFFAIYFTFFELLLAGGSWMVGVVIAWRKRDDWFALLTAVTLVLFGFLPPLVDGLIIANAGWQTPIVALRWLCLTGLMAVFSLFPNGRFVPHWLRFVLIGWIGNAIIVTIFRHDILADTAVLPNTGSREDALWLLFGVAWFVPIVTAQLYRYKQVSTAVERQQTKWVIFGFTITVAFSLFSAILLTGIPGLRNDPALNTMAALTLGVVYLLSALLLPLTFAFAIFRYRLWQIDYILNRTLVYGGLTGLVTAVYILLVGGVGSLAVSEQSHLLVFFVATVMVLLSIRPLHHWLQARADKWLPPAKPVSHAETSSKITGLVLLRAVWGIFVLLALTLFVAGSVYQTRIGFLQLPPEQVMASAPPLARMPFENDFFLENALYPFVLAGAYMQAATFVSVGLFLFWRKSGDVMGALASWMLIAIGLGFTPAIVLLPVLQPAWQLPTSLFQAGLFGSAFLFLCLFPNSRFYPYWSRYAVVGWLVYVLLWLPLPQLNLHRASAIWPSLVFASVIWIGVVAQILRYRRISGPDEKQQTKWVIVGFAVGNFGLLGIAFLLGSGAIHSAALLIGAILLLSLAPIFIPLTIAVALLRYRLWQIDIILNRSMVYIGLSLGIIAIYALTVGSLSLLFQSQNNLLISLLATGLIAVLFQPVRDRLQRSVNRLMFGERDDPYAVLSKLGRQLGETAVPTQTLPAITTTICQTLKLPYAAIELVANDQRQPAASSGEPGTAVLQEWPLRYQGEIVGWLQAAPRSPGEPFTAKEQQLLGDIAAQAGAAAYSLRLTNALQKSREKLVLTREEERRRIRRDLHDELGPTLASQTFAIDAILDLLETDPHEATRLLRGLKAQNQETVAEIRRLVYELRPPALDELGLVGALQAHAAQLNKPRGLQIQVVAQPDPLPPLSAAVEVAAYRIALEAMTNAARHAQAQSCAVCLQAEDTRFTLTIVDDGRGLEPNGRYGVGFHSMRERAEELGGRLSIESGEKGGTRVTAVIPLSSQSEADGA